MELRQDMAQQPSRRQSQRAAAIPAAALYQQLIERLEAIQEEQRGQAKINQQTEIALTKILGRLENVETWQEETDRRRERLEERRDDRDEKRPESRRADIAILVSVATFLVYALTFLAQHWRP